MRDFRGLLLKYAQERIFPATGHDSVVAQRQNRRAFSLPSVDPEYRSRAESQAPAVQPASVGWMDAAHDGLANVGRVGIGVVRPLANLSDRMYGTELENYLDSVTPQYRDPELETNPINKGLVTGATAATYGALAGLAGGTSVAGHAAEHVGKAAPLLGAFLAGGADAASIAAPIATGVNAGLDQRRANAYSQEQAELRRRGERPLPEFRNPAGVTDTDNVRRAIGSALNWASGTDALGVIGNIGG